MKNWHLLFASLRDDSYRRGFNMLNLMQKVDSSTKAEYCEAPLSSTNRFLAVGSNGNITYNRYSPYMLLKYLIWFWTDYYITGISIKQYAV